jgi:hypothetical protein
LISQLSYDCRTTGNQFAYLLPVYHATTLHQHLAIMSRALLLSFLLPLLVLAQQNQPSQLPPAQYNGGDDNPPDPSDAGAAGAQKGAFNLSKGALAAIIVVAVIVVIGGSTLPSSKLLTQTNNT